MSESTLYDPFAIFLQLLCPHLSQCHPSLFPPLFLSYDPNFVSILYPILNPSVLGLTNGSWLKTEILSLHQAPCPAQSTSYLTKDVKLSIKVYVQVQPLSMSVLFLFHTCQSYFIYYRVHTVWRLLSTFIIHQCLATAIRFFILSLSILSCHNLYSYFICHINCPRSLI